MHAQLHPFTSVQFKQDFSLHYRHKHQAQSISWPRAVSCHLLSLLLHLSYEPQQGHNHLLSQWASVCALLSAHTILLCKKIVQRVPSMQQQTTQTFLNETSQTQRQIPVKSIGRYKLFRCVPDCQEGFCKCSNEVWTAPRQDCQKLIPDCLMYSSSSSSFQPSCLSLLLFSLGIK